jgi:hypothetical protein
MNISLDWEDEKTPNAQGEPPSKYYVKDGLNYKPSLKAMS